MDTLPDLVFELLLQHCDLSTMISLMSTCRGYYSCLDLAPKLHQKMIPLMREKCKLSKASAGVTWRMLNDLCGLGNSGTLEEIEFCLPKHGYLKAKKQEIPILRMNWTGHPKAGVTTFILRWLTGEFYVNHRKAPLQKNGIYHLLLRTSKGSVLFLLYTDKESQHPKPSFSRLEPVKLDKPDCTVYFLTPGVDPNRGEVARFKDQRVLWCQSFFDSIHLPTNIWMVLQANPTFKYYNLSAKSNYNFEKPFLQALRWFFQDETVTIVDQVACTPAISS